MTRKLLAAAAALLLLPTFALAEDPRPAAPQWSIGAGLVGNTTYILGTASSLGTGLTGPGLLGANASLERSLGGGRWLVLGLSLQAERSRDDAGLVTRDDLVSTEVRGGVRFALTERGAPVEVSALLLADVGAAHTRVDQEGSSQSQDLAWLGASAGLAVERELVSNLAVRLSSPVISLTGAHTSTHVAGSPSFDGSTIAFGVALRPTLELRLAF